MPNEPLTFILLTEDDAGHARLIEKHLRRSKFRFELRHFAEGQQLLDYLDAVSLLRPHPQPIHYLILLDLNMPGIDGFQVLKRVKNHEHMHFIPVLVLSSSTDEIEIYRCYELGCAVYLAKPIEDQQFGETLIQLGNFLSVVQLPGAI